MTADVSITEEEVQAAYDEYVAADEANYTSSAYSFETAFTNGTTIYYTPEGYRNVKHILFRGTCTELSTLASTRCAVILRMRASGLNTRRCANTGPHRRKHG